jgi:hypothetical protein
MSSERWWLVGVFAVTLASASISTWSTAGPRLATASAATRHRWATQRDEVVEALLVSAPEPPAPAPAAPPPHRARARKPGSISIQVLDVPDLPEPPPQSPLLWDDLFPPPPPRAPGAPAAPCFDRLQGIAGFSPCPAVTPR